MERIARASKSATLNTLIFPIFFAASLKGTESVVTISVIYDFSIRSMAGPESTAWVHAANTCVAPALRRRHPARRPSDSADSDAESVLQAPASRTSDPQAHRNSPGSEAHADPASAPGSRRRFPASPPQASRKWEPAACLYGPAERGSSTAVQP